MVIKQIINMSTTKSDEPIDPSLVALMTKNKSPVKKRRTTLTSVGTKEAEKIKTKNKPPTPTGNINVQDIVQGLRQVLDAYDGNPPARRNSTGGGMTDGQRKYNAKIDELSERYGNPEPEKKIKKKREPEKKIKKKRKPSAYQIFVGQQMKLTEIKAINPFKERMAVVVLLWKKKKEDAKKEKEDGGVDALMKSKWSS
jgi:hypothetical protein